MASTGGAPSESDEAAPVEPAKIKPFDPRDPNPDKKYHHSADEVLRGFVDPETGTFIQRRWRARRQQPAAPVVTVQGKYITGVLDLRAVEFPYLLEFVDCRFEKPPDVRQAKLAGATFDNCWLPGLLGKNLRSDNDISLIRSTVEGSPIDLTDGEINGSLDLTGSLLDNPPGRGLLADRLVLAGALLAYNLEVRGECRVPGLRTGGNVNFSGAKLYNPLGNAINGNGLHVGGNLLCGVDVESDQPFRSTGWVFIPSARVESDMSFRGAWLAPGEVYDVPPAMDDRRPTLVADRMRVNGNVELDRGLTSTGTLRLVNVTITGSLWLTDATVDVTDGEPTPWPHRALHFDGAEVHGDVDATSMTVIGQVRWIDFSVQGNLELDEATMRNPDDAVLLAHRLVVGGNLEARDVDAEGTFVLQDCSIGANLDLGGSKFIEPGEREAGLRPSVDARAAKIGRDLICVKRGKRTFTAEGGIRLHRAEIGREATFKGAWLGSRTRFKDTALDAHGMVAQELVLTVGRRPCGKVNLRHARCASFDDNAKLWDATGKIMLEDFRYDAFATPIPVKNDKAVEERLSWLHKGMRGVYSPGPYDQFAAMLRAAGNEEHASTVLMAKQRHRYRALAQGYKVLGPGVRVWSWFQFLMVGYGYRPTRAVVWLLGLLAFGTVWFAVYGHPQPINTDDANLVWNPFLYSLDLVVPIVDFGNKNKWQILEASQWISATMIAMGWILATTVAAGVTRMLRRA
ncbi:hypothetical protein EV193_105370 [Herbihabitans rhizosphaerae]|uniref:Membrane-associated oxidoreductase n=1 Tax=Herbihabitans rhizosphaerae TaxID=1872711 RepID=A0A4Q7KQ34_9PSEU|nr:oxidoreductase [Herbihabitans rhizosphaerae]RZS37811.1 hypothetical protein EV193_105370 [Herbihabitans rhizosphaerae]